MSDNDDKTKDDELTNNILKILPGGDKTNLIKEALRFNRQLLDNLSEIQEFLSTNAKISKLKYDCLIKEGFTKEEAIKILLGTSLFS
jgi:hypothetical protein